MDEEDKISVKSKLGLALQEILSENKKSKKYNSVDSLRKLAAASGVEYSIIQKISTGQRDPQFTTLVSLAEGLNLSIIQFLSFYENITELPVAKKKVIRTKKRSVKK